MLACQGRCLNDQAQWRERHPSPRVTVREDSRSPHDTFDRTPVRVDDIDVGVDADVEVRAGGDIKVLILESESMMLMSTLVVDVDMVNIGRQLNK